MYLVCRHVRPPRFNKPPSQNVYLRTIHSFRVERCTVCGSSLCWMLSETCLSKSSSPLKHNRGTSAFRWFAVEQICQYWINITLNYQFIVNKKNLTRPLSPWANFSSSAAIFTHRASMCCCCCSALQLINFNISYKMFVWKESRRINKSFLGIPTIERCPMQNHAVYQSFILKGILSYKGISAHILDGIYYMPISSENL